MKIKTLEDKSVGTNDFMEEECDVFYPLSLGSLKHAKLHSDEIEKIVNLR